MTPAAASVAGLAPPRAILAPCPKFFPMYARSLEFDRPPSDTPRPRQLESMRWSAAAPPSPNCLAAAAAGRIGAGAEYHLALCA